MKLSEYLEKWEAEHATGKNLHITTVEGNGDIYNIEIRFPGNRYSMNQGRFDNVMNFLTRRSGGVLFGETSLQDFRNGFLSLKVAFCNHGHSDKKLITTIKMFLEELLPSFEK